MYLMNVPPVAVTQTEWRTCGPLGGYSLPVCFNDSDGELSTRGKPISDKVQMIIESLRSTQSSLEMGDEIKGNGLSGQAGHPDVCKVAVGSYTGARPKTKSPTGKAQENISSQNIHESSDSDSDDSVDRGIEEAILEYLKEKDGHKREGDPCTAFLQPSKIPRNSPSIPEISMQTPDCTTFSMNASHFPKSVKTEVPTGPAVIPIKKYIKNKTSLIENAFQSFDSTKSATKSLVSVKAQTVTLPKPIMFTNTAVQCPFRIKLEEELNDSSSDDGIEEAIQRYQLEKKEEQTKRDSFTSHEFDVDSDSTSDDGIEEAIRCYQLEQLKERSALKPFLNQEKSLSNSFMHSVGSTSTEAAKKQKLKKKRARTEKEMKPSLPLSSVLLCKTLSDSPKGKGNGLHSFKMDGLKEQPAPGPPKVTTNAELLCAEAILDISKTVMPEPFHQAVGLGGGTTKSSLQSSLPHNCPDDESNDSSIDSEDGIEQEIRKFLEQKAQMNKQPPGGSSAGQESPGASEQGKAKEATCQKTASRLSLTQRRKHKENNSGGSSTLEKVHAVQETVRQPLPEPTKEPNPLAFSQTSQTLSAADQSGDKSSSLDSDEDLDTAIKDLLKTKKRSKKKIRDLKRKSKNCLKDEEPLLGNALQAKKMKPDPLSKCNTLKKSQKSKDDTRDKFGLSKKSASQQKEIKSPELCMHEDEGEKLTGPQMPHTVEAARELKEESSSVDSDDSIELEIRRFLAEKAKVSTPEKSPDEEASRNGTAVGCIPLGTEDVKQENQLAEIPRKSVSLLSGQYPRSNATLNRAPLPTPQSLLPQDISAAGGQSCVHSVQSCGPSPLEPADGAGAARTEQKKLHAGTDNANPQAARAQPAFRPSVAHSRSESIKWRQSLGLPVPSVRAPSRTPFQITSSDSRKTGSVTLPYPGVGHNSNTSDDVWSCARTSKATSSCSTETAENPAYRSTVLNLFSTAMQHPRVSFTQSLMPGHRSQCSIEGERERTVHISKDKSVYVELETNRTNHVQVQSRERMEGKQRTDSASERKREGESVKIDDKEVQLESKEEEFIDEPDCESVNRRNPEKEQGFSTLCLSTAIDPGFTIIPCIALSTEERSRMYNQRYFGKTYKKEIAAVTRAPLHKRKLQYVKRQLQFLSTGQKRNPASTA